MKTKEKKGVALLVIFLCFLLWGSNAIQASAGKQKVLPRQPNILFVITDDQSQLHSSAYGCEWIKTPAMDRLAEGGILFENAYTPAPSCSPARAGVLNGRNVWQQQEGSVLWGRFPRQFPNYVDILKTLGYKAGYVGKGWGPGEGFISNNPAGEDWNRSRRNSSKSFFTRDYASDFAAFLASRDEGQPFVFWFGAHEPHRKFKEGAGYANGRTPDDVVVPAFLPDTPKIREELADYALEIEYFDEHLGRMIEQLEWIGELENTLIVVTSDNGMPFPRAKMTCYDYGTRMPLIAHWTEKIQPGRVVTDFVSLIDLAPTFLEVAGEVIPGTMTGRSLMPILVSEKSGQINPDWNWVLTGLERHVSWPAAAERAIRIDNLLYIEHPEPKIPRSTLDTPAWREVNALQSDHPLYELYAMRRGAMPEVELYDLAVDRECMNNLAEDPAYAEAKARLAAELASRLKEQNDPRAFGYGDVFNVYPDFKGWKYSGYHWQYINPEWAILKNNDWRIFGIPEDYFKLGNKPEYAGNKNAL